MVAKVFFPVAPENITKYLRQPGIHKKKLPVSTKMRRQIHKMETLCILFVHSVPPGI